MKVDIVNQILEVTYAVGDSFVTISQDSKDERITMESLNITGDSSDQSILVADNILEVIDILQDFNKRFNNLIQKSNGR